MLYFLAKAIMWPATQVFFRRMVISGAEHIPKNKPVILIANHSASFLDAIVVGLLIRRPMYFLARSDVFKPRAKKYMKGVHMIPIYNAEHSKEDLSRNMETFAEGEEVLRQKKILMIFPEGISRRERILLPLKKGTARIAFHTVSTHGFDIGLEVIPVGINYSFHRFRASVVVSVGDSTAIADYKTMYEENPAKAINVLTRELQEKFSNTVLYVDQAERTDLINQLLEYFRNDAIHRSDYRKKDLVIREEKSIADDVSEMDDDTASDVTESVFRYTHKLSNLRLNDRSIIHRYHSIFFHFFGLILGLPVTLCGAATGIVPVLLAKYIADKKVKRIDWYTSVSCVLGGMLFDIWFILLLIVSAFVQQWWFFIAVLLSPLTIYLAIQWWEAFKIFTAHARYLFLRNAKPQVIKDLEDLRNEFSFWRTNKNLRRRLFR
ncbi:1-acyl-sn-glycerol-3-phosphate acyltransferase [Pollutibacter soli]|uniref:1-acyl-sn-glycerol-3-phosphate acyltransferase n=1 Tax=Pollutibacter soli TaxID=3034157 RepID=UPI003013CD11